MKKNKTDELDQQWFDEQIGAALNRFDAVHERPMPDLHELERLVQEHKREAKRKLWRELALFWLTAICVLFTMLWLLDSSRIGFAIVQAVLAAGAIGFTGITFGKRMGQKWKS
ncbi:YxlC family protein [Paenibacillus sp. N4]|uniref:YxlC family protein n=1 Tax=Paenibacillus vietnamensis TaxID=2590547 RepID=UPI001CD14A9C|nr:YxlC family protein [Paenibacillus vietnamensis]MCA0756782.1 YxlC family protein [Paenibacillus vietnamensis]